MLPANLHLKDLYDTTVEFFAVRSPTISLRGPGTDESSDSFPVTRTLTPVPDPIAKLTRDCAQLRERLDASKRLHHPSSCSCSQNNIASTSVLPQPSMRRGHDAVKNELTRSQMDVSKMEDRCKALEKMLKETKETLRTREVEIDRLRRDRDRERPNLDRRRSSHDHSVYQQLVGVVEEGREDYPTDRQVTEGAHGMDRRHRKVSSGSITARRDADESRVMDRRMSVDRRHSVDQRQSSSSSMRRQYVDQGTSVDQKQSVDQRQRKTSGGSLAARQRQYVDRGTSMDQRHWTLNLTQITDRNASDALITASSELLVNEERIHRRGLETFLTKTDGWSGAQVIQAVQDLNSEVLQFAALATDFCSFDHARSLSSSKTLQPMQDTISRLGPHMAHVLSLRNSAHGPILVQLALQACISTCIARSLATFCVGFQSKVDDFLLQMYSHMCIAEPQPTSSRWRALAHRFTHIAQPELEEYAINELTETIFRWSTDVFVIAGGSSHEPDTSLRDSLRARFGLQVHRISRTVCKLARVTREEIMSKDFEVLAIQYGSTFDAKRMADTFADCGPSKGDILCTTELGLGCSSRTEIDVRTTDKDNFERQLLLKPKVVLNSVIDILELK